MQFNCKEKAPGHAANASVEAVTDQVSLDVSAHP